MPNMREWVNQFRQLRYPPEFRIEPALSVQVADAELKQTVQGPGEETREGPHRALLVEVGTRLWRLRRRMTDPGSGEPLPEMSRAYRQVEATWDALTRAGVEIIDHTNKPFDLGQGLKVISAEPMPDLSREVVIETMLPTIYIKGLQAQVGEVVVGVPPEDGGQLGSVKSDT